MKNFVFSIENRLVVAREQVDRVEMEQEFGVSRCELLYIVWINRKVLLCSIKYIQSYKKPWKRIYTLKK